MKKLYFMVNGFDDSGVGLEMEEWVQVLKDEAYELDAADPQGYVDYHLQDLVDEDEYIRLQGD